MNLAPLIILPIVGGYAFSVIWIGSLYNTTRESGHKLYFRAVFYAVFLVICASFVHILLFDNGCYQSLLFAINNILQSDEPFSIWGLNARISILIISFFLGPFLAHFLNLSWLNFNWLGQLLPTTQHFDLSIISKRWKTFVLKHAIANNDLELLLFSSFTRERPILFTLSTGKVYIGRIVRAPNPIEQRRAIRIVPLMSGYRNNESHRLEITTSYYDVISGLEQPIEDRAEHLKPLSQEDFEVVFPLDNVISCHLFDLDTYRIDFDKNNDV